MWTININPADKNDYSIYNKVENVVTLTKSFPEFLHTFLNSGVFDGLYEWRENIENRGDRDQRRRNIENKKLTITKKPWWKLW